MCDFFLSFFIMDDDDKGHSTGEVTDNGHLNVEINTLEENEKDKAALEIQYACKMYFAKKMEQVTQKL